MHEAITEVFYIDAFGKIRAYDCTELEQSANKTILNERTVVLDIFLCDNGNNVYVIRHQES